MSDTLRTFIAVPLPENVLSFISRIQERVKAYGFKASWTRPEGIHLTLKFLGDIDSGDVEIAGRAMSQAVNECPPLSLAVKGLGVFPGIKRPRVIWMGLKGDIVPLTELQKKIEEHLESAGFPKEDRPFRGHLTLARVKGEIDSKKLADAMKKFGDAESESFTADQIILFRSELKPSGAVYTRLRTSNLIKKIAMQSGFQTRSASSTMSKKMNEKLETAQTSYDEVPYGSHAFAQSHPDRLAVIGRLFGLNPAPVTRCRVLELGCASGGNLIPMACHLPESEFIGVDLSSRQVETGLKIIQDLGLKNIRIRHASILGLDDSWGKFDYIICHGVYSWVPKDVQDKILAVCSANLEDTGIAYVSYNTYPGWHQREALRQMMLYHVRQMKESKHRIDQAKALIDFLARCVPSENNPYGMMLKNEMSLINRVDDWYLFHDHLEEVNDPVYFWQFAENMGRHGLQYLGEADFSTMLTSRLPKEVAETLKQINHNIISTEQYMDFFRNRQFRQTLLCHQSAAVKRNIGPPDVMNFLAASAANTVDSEGKPAARTDLTSGIPQSFRGPRGSITTNRPLTKAAMAILRENWPRCLGIDALFNAAVQSLNHEKQAVQGDMQVLASDLLQAYTANAVEFRTWQGDFVITVSERPKVSPLAAYQNRQGKSVVSLRHEQVPADPLTQHLINFSDGTRNRSEMVRQLADMIKNGTLTAHRDNQPITDVAMIQSNLEQDVDRRLAYLAGSALLIG